MRDHRALTTRRFAVLVFACGLLAERRPSAQTLVRDGGAACGVCAVYAAPVVAGAVRDAAIVELSGLAASRRHPGVYYAHNDSGDSARFFAVRENGASAGRFELANATAIDWEDAAVGPCPQGSCVYLADTGGAAQRTEYAIYRVAEPDLRAPGAAAQAVAYERFAFTYPDGAHDSEALVVDPSAGAVYVITKAMLRAGVYRVPLAATGARATAVFVTSIALPSGILRLATGASAHPCEHRLLLRTYDRLFEFVAPAAAPFEAVFATRGSEVPVANERQGEAVGYRLDGRGYVTASEGPAPEMHTVGCR